MWLGLVGLSLISFFFLVVIYLNSLFLFTYSPQSIQSDLKIVWAQLLQDLRLLIMELQRIER